MKHAQARGAQAEVDSQALPRPHAVAQPQGRQDQLSQAKRRQHDQRGRCHDGQPLGQVLDVAQFPRRLAENDSRKVVPGTTSGNAFKSKNPRRIVPDSLREVGQRLDQEPAQPAKLQCRE